MSINPHDPVVSLGHDPVYQSFLSPTFHLPATLTLLSELPINDQLSKLASGIESIKLAIHRLTSAHCEEFFQRCSRLDELYHELVSIQLKASNLSKTLEVIRSRLELPYQQLLRQASLIAKFTRTCDLLRKMLRILYLARRLFECNLKADKGNETIKSSIVQKEAIKVSQYINEIDVLVAGEKDALGRLKPIASDLQRITAIKQQVSELADRFVKLGLLSSGTDAEASTLGTALQIFHNLSILDVKLEEIFKAKAEAITKEVNQFYVSANLKDPKLRSSSQVARNQSTTRQALRSMLDSVYAHFGHVTLIVRVLRRKRDNFSQTPLNEFLPQAGRTKINNFWSQVVKILSDRLVQFANESFGFKQNFESDYAALWAIMLEFYKKIVTEEAEIGENDRAFRSVCQHFESAYLSNSLSRLFEVVNRIFQASKNSSDSGQGVPNERELDMVIGELEAELEAVTFDHLLMVSVGKNVQKTMNVLNVKCEHIVAVNGQATQVIGPFTEAQQHNAFIVHIVHYFANKMKAMIESKNWPAEVKSMFTQTLKTSDTLVENIFQPLESSILEAIEAIILTMHNENFNILGTRESASSSLYMKELHRFLVRISHDYLSPYRGVAILAHRIHKMASRTIELFLMHICVLSPISALGRAKLVKDIEQLEAAIEPICERMGELGRSYQTLRAFSHALLPASLDELADKIATLVDNPVPYGLLVHFLISNYGLDPNGQEEIVTPRQFKRMSAHFYLVWYERADEMERINLFNQVLDAYVDKVRRSGRKTFSQVYPILIGIIRKTLATLEKVET